MATTLRAVFDGEVLRPERPLDLQPHTTYVVTIEREAPEDGAPDQAAYPLTEIGRLATDMGMTDLSINHDRYAHARDPDVDRHA